MAVTAVRPIRVNCERRQHEHDDWYTTGNCDYWSWLRCVNGDPYWPTENCKGTRRDNWAPVLVIQTQVHAVIEILKNCRLYTSFFTHPAIYVVSSFASSYIDISVPCSKALLCTHYAAEVEVEALSNAAIHRSCLSVSLSIRPMPLTQNLRVLDGYYIEHRSRTHRSTWPQRPWVWTFCFVDISKCKS